MTRVINLALQGGGSHGAFTWGVLDALLEDGRVGFEGISGTSAGAINAVAMAHGFAQAQGKPDASVRESARASLASFWEGIVKMGALNNSITQAQRAPFDMLFGSLGFGTANSPTQLMADAMASRRGERRNHRQSRDFFRQTPQCRRGDGLGVPAHGVPRGGD